MKIKKKLELTVLVIKGLVIGGGTYCPPGNNHSATRSRTATLL